MKRWTSPRLIVLMAVTVVATTALAIGGAVVSARSVARSAARKAAASVEVRSVARARARQAEEFNACLRGNASRGLELMDRLERSRAALQRALPLAPVLDCHATVYQAGGVGVPLNERETLRYVAELRRGRVPPILPGGHVR